jgi:hypothetical protein
VLIDLLPSGALPPQLVAGERICVYLVRAVREPERAVHGERLGEREVL